MGNSVVRGMAPVGFDRTECYPGANWDQLLSIITHSYQTIYANCIIFLSTGPVELTCKDKKSREVYLRTENEFKAIELRISTLKKRGVYVVLCTTFPMDFQLYNNHSKVVERVYEECYEEMKAHLIDSIVTLNHQIALMSDRHNYATPFVHSHILKRMHGKWKFRSWYLRDGLHPNEVTQRIQEWELTAKASATITRLANEKI